jgi:uncharacterized protein YfbU (UPF0304 family)
MLNYISALLNYISAMVNYISAMLHFISEGGKWNSHQMPCEYSSRMVKNYRICPIRIEIIHGRHRVVQIYTWAGPL